MAERVFVLKAQQNVLKHGITSEEASTVFDDPFLLVQDSGRNEEHRDAVIGFSSHGRLLIVVHIEVAYEYIRIISARRASSAEEAIYAE